LIFTSTQGTNIVLDGTLNYLGFKFVIDSIGILTMAKGDTMSICLPDALPAVILPTIICLLRQFTYDDSLTIIANLT